MVLSGARNPRNTTLRTASVPSSIRKVWLLTLVRNATTARKLVTMLETAAAGKHYVLEPATQPADFYFEQQRLVDTL